MPGSPEKDQLIASQTYSLILVEYILQILKVLMDVYILVTFVELSLEFLDLKLDQMDHKLTTANKMLIFWVFFVTFLNFVVAFG
jgi:hypothetical protein